jgi:16S rRNA processing protein RimM
VGERQILLGKIVGVFGVQGWVKLHSYTAPLENILTYEPWHLRHGAAERTIEKPKGRVQGKGLVAQLPGCEDRDEAARWVGAEIWIDRTQLPKARRGEVYWTDLEGLSVRTTDGTPLGTVSHLFSTGANDVIVVKGERERLIPFVRDDVVKEIDLEGGVLVVDWDPDF